MDRFRKLTYNKNEERAAPYNSATYFHISL